MKPALITTKQWFKYNYYMFLEHFMGLKWSEKHIRPKRNKLYEEVKKNPGMDTRVNLLPRVNSKSRILILKQLIERSY